MEKACEKEREEMKIRISKSTGCPVPQFVVTAETAEEKMMLRAILAFPQYAKDEWTFHLHGSGMEGGSPGYDHFNFGWIKAHDPEKDSEEKE